MLLVLKNYIQHDTHELLNNRILSSNYIETDQDVQDEWMLICQNIIYY